MKKIIIKNKQIEEEVLYQLKKINSKTTYITENNVLKLKKLDLDYIKHDNYDFLKFFTNLESISLNYTNLTTINFLKVLPNIKRLSLSNNRIKNINVLKNFKNLEMLDIRNNNISNINVLSFTLSLENINLKGNKIPNLAPLKDLDIKYLCVCNMILSEEDCNIISSWKNLQRICANNSIIKGSLRLNKRVNNANFINSNTDFVNIELLNTVEIAYFLENGLLQDFTHVSKILFLAINHLNINTDFDLLEKFIYEKELQFIYVKNLSFKDFKTLSKFKNLKILTDNNNIVEYILNNNLILKWYNSTFTQQTIDRIYCEEYIEHFISYLEEKQKLGFISHILYLKMLYLLIELAYEPDYYNYINFELVFSLYNSYFQDNEYTMRPYEKAKFKEFYAFLISNKKFANEKQKNDTLIRILKQSLSEKEGNFVYYKIIYFYLKNHDYNNALKYFRIVIDKKYTYNYYIGYYELILMKKFNHLTTSIISAIENFLADFKSLSNIEIELIYNLVLLEYSQNITNTITISYNSTEPILDEDVINTMVKNKIYEEIGYVLEEDKSVDEFYENLIKKPKVKRVINKYNLAIKKVAQGKLTIDDITTFDILPRGHWEEEHPI